MKKLLYISPSQENGTALRTVLEGTAEVVIVANAQQNDMNTCSAIVFEWLTDDAQSLKAVQHLRALAGDLKPIILSVDSNQCDRASVALDEGATGIVQRPFDSETTVPLLRGYLSFVPGRPSPHLDLCQPFIAATEEVFSTTVGIEAIWRRDRQSEVSPTFGDLCGIIGISGEAEGQVAISFPTELATRLIATLIGCDTDDLNEEEVLDGVGEIINQVAGRARSLLWESDLRFDISLPRRLTGCGLLTEDNSGPLHTECFEIDGSSFILQILVSPKEPHPASV